MKERLYNIELLRIISMFLIVCLHFTSFVVNLQDYDFNDPNRYFLWTLRGVAYTGTNLFILISAFFQCKSQFKLKNILLLWAQVFFYSAVCYFSALSFHWISFSPKMLLMSLMPIVFSEYWFVTCYFGLYLLAPFLNKLIDNIKKESLEVLIGILLLFFAVIPNLFFTSRWLNWGDSSGIVWFCVLYMMGAYIRNYVDTQALIKHKKILYLITLCLVLLPLLSKIIIANVTYFLCGEVIGSSIFYVKNSILLVPLSISIFLTFLTVNIQKSKAGLAVGTIASSVFSVYLISENPCLKNILWAFVSAKIDVSSLSCSLYAIVIPIFIFAICVIVDQMRKLIFSAISYSGIPQKICDALSVKISHHFQL